MVMQNKNKLQEYIDIVQKVAKVEHRRVPQHMVDYEELVSIGILAVQVGALFWGEQRLRCWGDDNTPHGEYPEGISPSGRFFGDFLIGEKVTRGERSRNIFVHRG